MLKQFALLCFALFCFFAALLCFAAFLLCFVFAIEFASLGCLWLPFIIFVSGGSPGRSGVFEAPFCEAWTCSFTPTLALVVSGARCWTNQRTLRQDSEEAGPLGDYVLGAQFLVVLTLSASVSPSGWVALALASQLMPGLGNGDPPKV